MNKHSPFLLPVLSGIFAFNNRVTVTVNFQDGKWFSLTDFHEGRFLSSTNQFSRQWEQCKELFPVPHGYDSLVGLHSGSMLLENGALQIQIILFRRMLVMVQMQLAGFFRVVFCLNLFK